MDDDEKIDHPTLELYRHTMIRGANFGSLLSLALAPPYLLFKGVRSPLELLRRTGSIAAKGTAAGVVFGIALTVMKTHGNAEEQIFDRCYRLRHNRGQVRADKFSYGGIVLGGLGGGAAGLSSAGPLVSSVQGASMGVGLAILAHIITKRSYKTPEQIEEKQAKKEEKKAKKDEKNEEKKAQKDVKKEDKKAEKEEKKAEKEERKAEKE